MRSISFNFPTQMNVQVVFDQSGKILISIVIDPPMPASGESPDPIDKPDLDLPRLLLFICDARTFHLYENHASPDSFLTWVALCGECPEIGISVG